MTTTTEKTIVKELTIKAPAAQVFAALTDPAEMRQWWHDESHQVETVESNLRVGGTWRISSIKPRGHVIYGEYRIIDPPRTLELTWNNDVHDGMGETIVRYDLSEQDGTTHVRLTHTGFGTQEAAAEHDKGWSVVLSWLERYLRVQR